MANIQLTNKFDSRKEKVVITNSVGQKIEGMVLKYSTLNDANLYSPCYSEGETEIWYMKQFNPLCTYSKANLEKTHVLLGKINESNLETIFCKMQGENWSPNGEAFGLILSKGLKHTSMTAGDVVKIKDKYFLCTMFSWLEWESKKFINDVHIK